jgi:hypothetical protein
MANALKTGKSETSYLRLPHRCDEDEVIADFSGWIQYFVRHLGGYPRQVRMFIEGAMETLNVPAEKPEIFDPTFERSQDWILPRSSAMADLQWRERAKTRPPPAVDICNLFVPKNAPGYDNMLQLAKEDRLGETYAVNGRSNKPYFRITDSGIYVNLKDYLAHVRRPA